MGRGDTSLCHQCCQVSNKHLAVPTFHCRINRKFYLITITWCVELCLLAPVTVKLLSASRWPVVQ